MENYEDEYRVGADYRKEWQKEMKEKFHKQNTREGRIEIHIEELKEEIANARHKVWDFKSKIGKMTDEELDKYFTEKDEELNKLKEALEQEKPKCIFISASPESIDKMYHYLKGDLLIAETEKDNFIGYGRIFVPKRTYEWALRNGRNYAYTENFEIYWVNYNGSRKSSAAMDIGYGVFPNALLPGEEKEEYSCRGNWFFDKYTPPYLLEYFKSMQEYVCCNDEFKKRITRDYDGGGIRITVYGIDHKEKSKLLEEFIEKYGYGPFETIYPLTYTGEQEKKPFQLKKTK